MLSKSELCILLTQRIKSSDLWGPRSKESATKIYGLVCPECSRPDAWAYADFPAVIMCSHKSSCGARTKTLELFPDVIPNIEKEFPPTKSDPDRAAREYLYSRGLTMKSMDGLRFRYQQKIRGGKSGGVMFHVGKNSAGQEVWNGRIFYPDPGEDKAHNSGSTAGVVWRHPGIVYDPGKPTFVTEAVIEGLSLVEMDLQAVSVLTSVADPNKIDLGGLEKNLVIALNPDDAGADGLRKWKALYPYARAAVPTEGDWNDFLRAHAPGKAKDVFEEKLSEMEFRADLLLSETAWEYADKWTDHYESPPGLFKFRRRYYYAQPLRSNSMIHSCMCSCVSDFVCDTDHYQLDTSGADNAVYRYCLKVSPANGQPVWCSVSGSDLANPQAIRSALLSHAKVNWMGEANPSKALVSRIVDSKAPVVRQVHMLGHDDASGCMVFHDFMIDRDGKMHVPDKQGFFRPSRKEYLRPPQIQSVLPRKGVDVSRIFELIDAAWPGNGALAVAYTVASWFVHVVKPELGFFPFLSLWGDTQTGKSRLMRRLYAMQALDDEGLPMTKLNTGKGEIRELAKRSSLMIGLLEGNGEEKMRFDLNSLLTLFNYGNPLQVRAKKSNDLATTQVDFLATLAFVQNREPFKTKAQMERVISSMPFRSDDINERTTEAFRALERIPLRDMGWCYVEVMAQRKSFEQEWYAEYCKARDEILKEVPDNRIAETHGLVLGFARIAEKIFGAKNDPGWYISALAARKHKQCNHRQVTLADHFFEACQDVSPEQQAKFMDIELGRVYIRLPFALKTLDGLGYKNFVGPLHADLREHPSFITSGKNHRAAWDYDMLTVKSSVAKTWVFDEAKIGFSDEC